MGLQSHGKDSPAEGPRLQSKGGAEVGARGTVHCMKDNFVFGQIQDVDISYLYLSFIYILVI